MSDTVEILMAVEASFGVEIADEEAERVVTVGELHKCVARKLEAKWGGEQSGPCLSSLMFYQMRRALIEAFGVARAAVKPDSPTEPLVPRSDRRENWVRLGQSLDVRLPDLQRPRWMENALGCLVLAVPLATMFSAQMQSGFSWAAVFLSSSFVVWAAHKATVPLAVYLPPECGTMRGCVETITGANYAALARKHGGWNRRESWQALRALVAHMAGVEAAQVVEDTRLVQDLHLD